LGPQPPRWARAPPRARRAARVQRVPRGAKAPPLALRKRAAPARGRVPLMRRTDRAPSRTDTPPRSGSAPIRLLRICLDERVLGGIEVNESSTLADVRATIAEDEIGGVPANYSFLFGGAPVTRRQEGRRRAGDCFPFLTIIPEGATVAHPAAADAGGITPLPSNAQVLTFDGPEAPSDRASAASLAGAGDGGPFEEPLDDRPAPPGDAEGLLELQITDGPLEGTTVTVGAEGARIGRHTSNTLVIPEAGISRYHCEICHGDGDFSVRDLGSTTGTYFHLRPYAHFQMFPGLMVKLGETEFKVLSQTLSGETPEQLVWFYEGPLAGHKAYVPAVPAGSVTIGRRHNNSLVLAQDGTISAHHAMIFYEDGEFFICDLGSCNGTCVRLSAERADSDWHPIMDGDVLGAGCTKVRCRVHSWRGRGDG